MLLEASISIGVRDGCVTSYAQRVRPHLYIKDDIRWENVWTEVEGIHVGVSSRQSSFVKFPHGEACDL